MKHYREYKELSQQIHAPEELKDKVFEAAAHGTPKRTAGRGWSLLSRVAVAAVLAVVLPVTAYAAVDGSGLLDYITRWNSRVDADIPIVSLEEPTYRNSFAEYTVLEAAWDSEKVYVAAKIQPLDDNNLLVPQFVMEEESVTVLQIDGVTEGTVAEYAASLGKKLVYADIAYESTEGHLNDTSYWFKCMADGTLYYYCTAPIAFEGEELTLKCFGLAYTEEMTLAERVEFETQLEKKSIADASAETEG